MPTTLFGQSSILIKSIVSAEGYRGGFKVYQNRHYCRLKCFVELLESPWASSAPFLQEERDYSSIESPRKDMLLDIV